MWKGQSVDPHEPSRIAPESRTNRFRGEGFRDWKSTARDIYVFAPGLTRFESGSTSRGTKNPAAGFLCYPRRNG